MNGDSSPHTHSQTHEKHYTRFNHLRDLIAGKTYTKSNWSDTVAQISRLSTGLHKVLIPVGKDFYNEK